MTRARPLPVLNPLSPALLPAKRGLRFGLGQPSTGSRIVIVPIAGSLLVGAAKAGAAQALIVEVLAKWTPLLVRGFALNMLMSVLAMAAGTALGLVVGIGQLSRRRPLRLMAKALTQVFRNAPWLVLLFYCMLLIPFQVRLGSVTILLPDWLKATAGLSLAVMANVSELVRGAIQSIPSGQWEAGRALAFTRTQMLRLIILPQCVKRMLPPWMNVYAILVVSTPLCSIVGVNEVMTLTADALNAEPRHDLLIPMYLYVLAWFFIYCFPIARWTVRLERRFAQES